MPTTTTDDINPARIAVIYDDQTTPLGDIQLEFTLDFPCGWTNITWSEEKRRAHIAFAEMDESNTTIIAINSADVDIENFIHKARPCVNGTVRGQGANWLVCWQRTCDPYENKCKYSRLYEDSTKEHSYMINQYCKGDFNRIELDINGTCSICRSGSRKPTTNDPICEMVNDCNIPQNECTFGLRNIKIKNICQPRNELTELGICKPCGKCEILHEGICRPYSVCRNGWGFLGCMIELVALLDSEPQCK